MISTPAMIDEVSSMSVWATVVITVVATVASQVILILIIAGAKSSWRCVPRIRSVLKVQGVLAREGLLYFIGNRSDYARYRGAEQPLQTYPLHAHSTLDIVGINLVSGMQFDDLCARLEALVAQEPPVEVRISLLDPEAEEVVAGIAPSLGRDLGRLREEIKDSVRRLCKFREHLSNAQRPHIQIRVHKALPCASAIIVDGDQEDGVIQVETKAYKAPFNESFGFALRRGDGLYKSLLTGYKAVVEEGRMVNKGLG